MQVLGFLWAPSQNFRLWHQIHLGRQRGAACPADAKHRRSPGEKRKDVQDFNARLSFQFNHYDQDSFAFDIWTYSLRTFYTLATIQYLLQNIQQKEWNDLFHQDHQRLSKRRTTNFLNEIQPVNRIATRNQLSHIKEVINRSWWIKCKSIIIRSVWYQFHRVLRRWRQFNSRKRRTSRWVAVSG